MDPLLYCVFMLSCFGEIRKQTILLKCPDHCECFQSSSNGISGADAESFVCNDLSFLTAYSFNTKQINTFVLRNVQFQQEDYSANKKYQTISVVLENFNHNQNAGPTNTQYIFNLFDHRTLKYLTILKSSFELPNSPSFDWTSLGIFSNLQTIYIANSKLPILGESFATISLNKLHTLIIKSSSLEYIDREALVGKLNLRKIIITDNAIRNWNWLTSLKQPLKELWHLDLTSNHLTFIPDDLKSVLPNLRVFHLAHNRLRYFSYNAMQPWFAIDEFQPSNQKPGEVASKNTFNYIYYRQDIEKILKTPDFTAEYFVESFNQIHYICNKLGAPAVNNWNEFNHFCRQSNSYFDYLPDNLRISPNKNNIKLEANLENGDVNAKTVFIRGLDLGQKSLINPGEVFYFDSTSTQSKYRQNRAYLMNQLNSMINTQNNAIRLHLFSKTMLDYFFGKTSITNEHIQLIIDLVVDYLDDVAERKFYVMLIMWNHADVVASLRGQSLDYVNSQNIFKETMLLPLLKRISSHPALIGIEIMDQFLSNEISSDTPSEGTNECLNSKWNGLPQIRFLGVNAEMVKQNSGNKLIGLSVDSNCQHCFQIAMKESCRKSMEFTFVNGYDFITFINIANDDTYSYANYHKHLPVWINKADDNVLQPDFKNRGIFHVIQTTLTENDIEANKESTSGFFIAQS